MRNHTKDMAHGTHGAPNNMPNPIYGSLLNSRATISPCRTPLINRTGSRDHANRIFDGCTEQCTIGRTGYPRDKRNIGLPGYPPDRLALSVPAYPADRRLAKTANLVFQTAPWATGSTEDPKRTVRRNFSTGRQGNCTPVKKDGSGLLKDKVCLRRFLGSRAPVGAQTLDTNPVSGQQSRTGLDTGYGKVAVNDAPRPVVQRNEKMPNAVAAVDPNLHYRAYMEDGHKLIDRLYLSSDQQWGMYAVIDGHGGRWVTDKCLTRLHEFVLAELVALPNFPNPDSAAVRRALEKSFVAMDEALKTRDAWHCGATCTVTLIHSNRGGGRKLYVANVGDSRCVLVSGEKEIRASIDHRANDPDEMLRVQSEGGIISRGRVGGQLMLTRALGDFSLKNIGVSCMPYTTCKHLKPDDAIIIASDGLWDVLSDADAGRICTSAKQKHGNVKIVARNLVDQAVIRGSTDNITCVVVFV
eukprot:GEMP01018729.1.p1 GENE.GEMP01018729.1~~GEMP01018729.1.p1  ORF type:complete len:469 (+),score=70.36 GEMP01018729.1:99-1505(+)